MKLARKQELVNRMTPSWKTRKSGRTENELFPGWGNSSTEIDKQRTVFFFLSYENFLNKDVKRSEKKKERENIIYVPFSLIVSYV